MVRLDKPSFFDSKYINKVYFEYHSTPDRALPAKLPDANYLKIWSDAEQQYVGITAWRKIAPDLYMTGPTILEPEYRGKGLGKHVSQAIEDYVASMGARKVVCEVLTFNLPMVIIKLKQGYLVEGVMMHHDAHNVHQYYLGKVLK